MISWCSEVLLAGSGGRYEMSAFSDLEYLVALGSPEPCDKALLKKVRGGSPGGAHTRRAKWCTS